MDGLDAIIIGAGAAGMFCAREASLRGRRVAVVDHGDQPGRKLLVSGGGRCNFTNLNAGPDAYVSGNPRFCVSALARFVPDDFIRLLDAHGIPWHEKTLGQLFCDRSAEDVRDMLVTDCRNAGAEFLMSRKVENIQRMEGVFHVKTSREILAAPRLVVATGGLSAGSTGASDFGIEVAHRFGLKVVDPEAALVGLRWGEENRQQWEEMAGVTLPEVVVSSGGREFREAVLFTHAGLSGPAILQASLYWRPGDAVVIDLLPNMDPRTWFKAVRLDRGSAKPWEILDQRLPQRFVERFASLFLPDEPMARISDAEIEDLVVKIKAWKFVPVCTESMEKAEVMRGGVDTDELSSQTMESRKVPRLYFIGEVVDVTGQLGGYNLHWAWASGAAAGRVI